MVIFFLFEINLLLKYQIIIFTKKKQISVLLLQLCLKFLLQQHGLTMEVNTLTKKKKRCMEWTLVWFNSSQILKSWKHVQHKSRFVLQNHDCYQQLQLESQIDIQNKTNTQKLLLVGTTLSNEPKSKKKKKEIAKVWNDGDTSNYYVFGLNQWYQLFKSIDLIKKYNSILNNNNYQ